MAEHEVHSEDRATGNKIEAGKSALGCANLVTGVSVFNWFGLFVRAANHYAEIAALGYSGTWDVWVWLPLGIALASLLAALTVNLLFRAAVVLLIPFSLLALMGVLPYLVMTGGGV